MRERRVTDAVNEMKKPILSFESESKKIRTGRAHPDLLDQVRVDYYGQVTPLSQVASITVASDDARMLVVTPWEKPLIPVIEKAILNADLGLNPANQGLVIRIPLPPLTRERREALMKQVRAQAEQARVSIRNIRRDHVSGIRAALKAKELTEDEARQLEQQLQKATDDSIAEVAALSDQKEKELMVV